LGVKKVRKLTSDKRTTAFRPRLKVGLEAVAPICVDAIGALPPLPDGRGSHCHYPGRRIIGCSAWFTELTDQRGVWIIRLGMNRSFRLFFSGLLFALLSLSGAGCAGDQPTAIVEQGEPIGTQLLRAVPWLDDERFSTLLDFESTDDAVFCTTTGGRGVIANEKAHTGRASFRIDSATQRLSVKLSSLLAGRQFPGEWTLVGGYFYSEQPAKIIVNPGPATNGFEPHEVELAPGTWTGVFAELPAEANQQVVPSLVFDLQSPHGTIWCDDVMLIDNYRVLTGPSEAMAPDTQNASALASGVGSGTASNDVLTGAMPPWMILRRGLNFVGSAPARFNFKLATSEASSGGWIVDEASPMRARFHSTSNRFMTVYADGRAFWDGQYKPMSVAARDPTLVAQHQSPAQIEVAEGMGRVDRNTPGDANNDGYNETTGSYRIIASGPRVELRFAPTKSPVLSPILEISGLPFGKPLVTLEGRLIEQSTRTSSGTLLVELPAKIDRPVTVNVRIEE